MVKQIQKIIHHQQQDKDEEESGDKRSWGFCEGALIATPPRDDDDAFGMIRSSSSKKDKRNVLDLLCIFLSTGTIVRGFL
jgi:hypothetical protein